MKQPLLEQICTAEQQEAIQLYVKMLKDINTKVNLISRKDTDNIIEHHILPCLAYSVLERIKPNEYILDIGSGGGLPGIVNAIMFPTSEFLLVDSTRKKIKALDGFIEALQLNNVETRWNRTDELLKEPALQNSFDRTTSRAVAPLKKLVQWSTPFLKEGGTVEALKGGDLTEEIKRFGKPVELHTLPAQFHNTDRLSTLSICTVEIQ